jgi:hypothetical protein
MFTLQERAERDPPLLNETRQQACSDMIGFNASKVSKMCIQYQTNITGFGTFLFLLLTIAAFVRNILPFVKYLPAGRSFASAHLGWYDAEIDEGKINHNLRGLRRPPRSQRSCLVIEDRLNGDQ